MSRDAGGGDDQQVFKMAVCALTLFAIKKIREQKKKKERKKLPLSIKVTFKSSQTVNNVI